MQRLILAATAALFIASPAFAAPTGCEGVTVASGSPVIGVWTLNQDDDGPQPRGGDWAVEFKADGTWLQGGDVVGGWCVTEGLLLFSFDEDPHTTYRGAVSARTIEGTESWDGGGTGVFDLVRGAK